MDDPFVPCPYNPVHRVSRSRLQAHVAKCQKEYPKLYICPFNATHRLPKTEIKDHVNNCPFKQFIFPESRPTQLKAALTNPRPILQRDYLPETDPLHETWDD